jgi:hypothetical protein
MPISKTEARVLASALRYLNTVYRLSESSPCVDHKDQEPSICLKTETPCNSTQTNSAEAALLHNELAKASDRVLSLCHSMVEQHKAELCPIPKMGK